jgi:hypothetical protein
MASDAKANGQSTSPQGYTLLDQPLEQPKKIRIACIGAGVSGILTAIKVSFRLYKSIASVPHIYSQVQEQLENVDLVLYDKNRDLGGTWVSLLRS